MHISDVVFGFSIALLVGVATASLALSTTTAVPAVFISLIIALALTRKINLWKYAFIFSLAMFLGIFYYNFYLNLHEARTNIFLGEEVVFSGIVANEPKIFEKYQLFDLKLSPPMRGEITVLAPPLLNLNYGDLLEIKGEIQPPEKRSRNPVSFFPEIEVVESGHGLWLKEKLLGFKRNLLRQFSEHLSHDKSALLGGITLGSRSGFSEELREAMSVSGTTHLVALSGYNIAILVMAVAYALGSFLSRRKTFYATSAIIFMFVLMVGGEPSVIRAATMGFMALFAKEIGRKYSVRNAIAVTATTMVFINPRILLDDVGFQLSFASLIGIVYLSPAIKNIFKIKDGGGFLSWKENIVLTASAQAMVLPIIIGTFGQFSLTSVAANILVLGFIPITMFLGFSLAALSSLYFYFGFFAAKLAGLLLAYEIWIMELFGEISVPVSSPGNAIAFVILYYLAIVIFAYNFSKNERTK